MLKFSKCYKANFPGVLHVGGRGEEQEEFVQLSIHIFHKDNFIEHQW